jgi:hypothetical protein
MRLFAGILLLISSGVLPLWGQNQGDRVPIYRVTVERRTIRAINYGHRTEPTRIDFRGTVLLPAAKGEARVESKGAAVEVDAKMENLDPPTRFGAQYLTYVLWAITPEGRPINLGEVVPDGSNKAKLKVTAPAQAFGLLVTAEPYFAVTQPSNVVVLENALRPDTVGKVEEVEARYELLPRTPSPTPTSIDTQPAVLTGKALPMDQYEAVLALYQAQNAVQIARAQGAAVYAGDTLQKAEQLYSQARRLEMDKGESRRVVMMAREAAQAAEDARSIALRHEPR